MKALQCVCGFPGCPMPANLKRQDTAYHDEESNWVSLCFAHELENDAYWRERWDDYYREVSFL